MRVFLAKLGFGNVSGQCFTPPIIYEHSQLSPSALAGPLTRPDNTQQIVNFHTQTILFLDI